MKKIVIRQGEKQIELPIGTNVEISIQDDEKKSLIWGLIAVNEQIASINIGDNLANNSSLRRAWPRSSKKKKSQTPNDGVAWTQPGFEAP